MSNELTDLIVEEISIVGGKIAGQDQPGPAVPQSRFLIIKSEDEMPAIYGYPSEWDYTEALSDYDELSEEIEKAQKKFKDLSYTPWASVDKTALPKEAFIWVEDPEKKSTWHLPYREGEGEKDPKTGMYKKAGKINYHALVAIYAAFQGARTGKPMSVPAEAKKKTEALFKKYKIGKYREGEKVEKDKQQVVGEEPIQIDYDDLSDEARERVGKSLFKRLFSKFSSSGNGGEGGKEIEIDVSKTVDYSTASQLQNVTRNMASKFYLLEDVLQAIMKDPDDQDKIGSAKKAISQFSNELKTVVESIETGKKGVKKMGEEKAEQEEIHKETKAGNKISGANMATLKRIRDLIDSMLSSGAAQTSNEKGGEIKKEEVSELKDLLSGLSIEEHITFVDDEKMQGDEAGEINNGEIAKAVDEKMAPITEAIAGLTANLDKLMQLSGISKEKSETQIAKEDEWEFSGLCDF